MNWYFRPLLSKSLVVSILLLMISALAIVLIFCIISSVRFKEQSNIKSTEKEYPYANNLNVVSPKGIEEGWMINNYKDIVSLRLPEHWILGTKFGQQCSFKEDSNSICIEISSPNLNQGIQIKVEALEDSEYYDSEGGIIYGEDLTRSTFIQVENGDYMLIPGITPYTYTGINGKQYLTVYFIESHIDQDQLINLDASSKLKIATWKVYGEKGLTVSYLIEDIYDRDFDTLNLILSTLEFNFEADPFE